MTPTPDSPISFASKCASLAPEKTTLRVVSKSASTSLFRRIRAAIASALSTSITRGTSP